MKKLAWREILNIRNPRNGVKNLLFSEPFPLCDKVKKFPAAEKLDDQDHELGVLVNLARIDFKKEKRG